MGKAKPSRGERPDLDSLCILPWLSYSTMTDGRITPCCINDDVLANAAETAPAEILNSSGFKQYRQQMLEGKLPPSCARQCGSRVKGTLRSTSNQRYAKHFDLLEKTETDGTLSELRYVFLNPRVSNVCNFKCRSCYSVSSSSIARERQEAGELPIGEPVQKRCFPSFPKLLEFFEQHAHTLELIHFAGGEPLLAQEQYEILEKLISLKRTNITLRYSTNLSNLGLGKWDAISLWNRFDKVVIKASLDAMGPRAEYMRHGTDWNVIEDNRRRLMKEAKTIEFAAAPTIQLMNSFHVPEFHFDWIQKGLLKPHEILLGNILEAPTYLSIFVLPKPLKQKVCALWWEYSEKLASLGAGSQAMEAMDVCRVVVSKDHWEAQKAEFRRVTLELDRRRGENFERTFPELASLLSE